MYIHLSIKNIIYENLFIGMKLGTNAHVLTCVPDDRRRRPNNSASPPHQWGVFITLRQAFQQVLLVFDHAQPEEQLKFRLDVPAARTRSFLFREADKFKSNSTCLGVRWTGKKLEFLRMSSTW